jgi:hypothetical protein
MATAKKAAPAKRTTATERTRRSTNPTAPHTSARGNPRPVAGKPGPIPAVLRGFSYNPPDGHPDHDYNEDPGPHWRHDSPVDRVLKVLLSGAKWELAAAVAGLHESTPRAWNLRGEAILTDTITRVGATPDAPLDLDGYAEHAESPEDLALVAFHLAAREARALPVSNALATIARASQAEWRAAALALKVLPGARDYRETTRAEVTGADGGPVTVDAGRVMLDLIGGYRTNPPAEEETDDEGSDPPA